MNKLVIKEIKTKRKCQHSKGCNNQADYILKLNGIKKYLCEDCMVQLFREVSNDYFEESMK